MTETLLVWFFVGILGIALAVVVLMFLFITVDTFFDFRISTWFEEGEWLKSPRTRIRERKQRKAQMLVDLERQKRREETAAIERYYRERTTSRRQEADGWTMQFKELTNPSKSRPDVAVFNDLDANMAYAQALADQYHALLTWEKQGKKYGGSSQKLANLKDPSHDSAIKHYVDYIYYSNGKS